MRLLNVLFLLSFLCARSQDQQAEWKKVKRVKHPRDSFLLSTPDVEYAFGDVKKVNGKFVHRLGGKIKPKDTIGRVTNAYVRVKQESVHYNYRHIRMGFRHNDTLLLVFPLGDENWFINLVVKVVKGKYQLSFIPNYSYNYEDFEEYSVKWTMESSELTLNSKKLVLGDSIAGELNAVFFIEGNKFSKKSWQYKMGTDRWKYRTEVRAGFRGKLDVKNKIP